MNETDNMGPEDKGTTAAKWVARLRDESVDAATDAKFRAWPASDAAHELELERCEMALAMTEELEEWTRAPPVLRRMC